MTPLGVHKCSGAGGSTAGSSALPFISEGEACYGVVGQRVPSVSHQPLGGDQVGKAVGGYPATSNLGSALPS